MQRRRDNTRWNNLPGNKLCRRPTDSWTNWGQSREFLGPHLTRGVLALRFSVEIASQDVNVIIHVSGPKLRKIATNSFVRAIMLPSCSQRIRLIHFVDSIEGTGACEASDKILHTVLSCRPVTTICMNWSRVRARCGRFHHFFSLLWSRDSTCWGRTIRSRGIHG